MEWSNEKIIEFLELFQMEPCLWNPKEKSHKNRVSQNDAWRRILQGLPFPATIEDLKKKKESLMGYYRIHLNKYKKSLKSGAGINDVYTTNWFAFDIMNSFLKTIYEGNTTLNTEFSISSNAENATNSDQETTSASENPTPVPSTSKCENLPTQGIKRSISSQTNQHHFVTKRIPLEIATAKKQVDEAFNRFQSLLNKKQTQDLDEYDHFASMIAAKIRKINDLHEREILMNSIQNLVFQSIMKINNTVTITRPITSNSSSVSLSNSDSNISIYSTISNNPFLTQESVSKVEETQEMSETEEYI